MKIRLFAAIVCFPWLLPAAFSSPIMAPVLYKKGAVTATAPGSGAVHSDKGGALPEKTAVHTEPGGTITFSTYPGGAVMLDEKTDSTIQHLEVVRAGEHIQRRAALMRLDAGRLFYSILKFQNKVTQLQVTTPDRVVSVHEKPPKPGGTDVAGMVEIQDKKTYAAILTGAASIAAAGGNAITVDAGSLYSSDGAHITVLNLVTGNFSSYDESGNLLDTRTATGPELLAGRTEFQSALGIAEEAISDAGLDPGIATAIAHTINLINGYLTSNGVASISDTAIGAALSSQTSPQLPGMDNAGIVNPANISGVIRSGER